MRTGSSPQERPPIQFSCYFTRFREGEQFVPEHAISLVLSGTTILDNGFGTQAFSEGDCYFVHRNQLIKYQKRPPQNGEFRAISIYFDQEMLRNFSVEFNYTALAHTHSEQDIPSWQLLPPGSVLSKYMTSLREYETMLTQPGTGDLLAIKQKEAIMLLINLRPELKSILFDFSEPGKIDLEAFMRQHYHFNVGLPRFAYLTGRSLSTFKRDFEKIFHATPSRWLLQRRLEEAHYLLKEKKKVASDIYLDLGFEDLSHFSYVFKKQYGVAPSMI